MSRAAGASRAGATTVNDDVTTDQRRTRRAPRRLEAWVQTNEGEVFDGYTVDVSGDGLCIKALGIPAQVGDRVRVCVARASAMAEGWVTAEVRWRSGERIGLELYPDDM